MLVGVPKEIKNNENRVAMTPASVFSYVNAGHTVYVEKDAGIGSNYQDADLCKRGQKLLKQLKKLGM